MQDNKKPLDSPSNGNPSLAQIGTSSATGIAAPPPPPKRSKREEADDWDSQSDSSDEGNDGDSSTHSQKGTGKDGNVRLSLRKEKKSAREKARRQRENALFEELANMCNVPADTRDKSSVLKAVIRRVEELRSKNNGAPPGTRLPSDMLQGIPGFPAFSAAAANGQPTVDDLLLAASRGAWAMSTASAPPPPPPPPAQMAQATQPPSQYHHNTQMFPTSFSTLNGNSGSYALPQSTGSFNYMNSQPASNNLAPMFPNMFQAPQLGGFSQPQQPPAPPAPQQHNSASVYGNPALNGTLNISPSNAAGLSSNLKMFVPDFLMHRSGEASDVNNNRV